MTNYVVVDVDGTFAANNDENDEPEPKRARGPERVYDKLGL